MAGGELRSLGLVMCVCIIRVTLFALVILPWSIFTIFLLLWINKLALFHWALPFTVVYIIEPWERLPSLARRRSDFNRFSPSVWLIDGFIWILSRFSISARLMGRFGEDLEDLEYKTSGCFVDVNFDSDIYIYNSIWIQYECKNKFCKQIYLKRNF